MSEKDGGPAFPALWSHSQPEPNLGMTLRDYFAAQAIKSNAGYVADLVSDKCEGERLAEQCRYLAIAAYAIAAAMLKERAK